MKTVIRIYHSHIYILFVVIIALVTLFIDLPYSVSWAVYSLFVLDLLLGTLVYLFEEKEKSFKKYLKIFIFDILACVPFYEFRLLKAFRLFRVVRITKLKKVTNRSWRINWSNVFNFQTVKELSVWLIIYFIANLYIFEQVESKNFLDALYWLVETVTTVGYGDMTPTHPATKIMGIILMLIGVATIGYVNGVITTTIVRRLNQSKE